MQKTNFPFEIVIGEDCSTDGTREIVFEYENKYPGIIRVITSDMNVGMQANSKRTGAACRGEYIAFCEGDDYWIDPLKLQRQYDACKKHNAVLAAHNTITLSHQGVLIDGIRLYVKTGNSGLIIPEDIILQKKDMHTSAMFVRNDLVNDLPEWVDQAPSGDTPLKLLAIERGEIYFIDEIMSVHLKGLPGSASEGGKKYKTVGEAGYMRFIMKQLAMFKNFDIHTDHRYHEPVRGRCMNILWKQIFINGNMVHKQIDPDCKYPIGSFRRISKFLPARLKSIIENKILADLVDVYFEDQNQAK